MSPSRTAGSSADAGKLSSAPVASMASATSRRSRPRAHRTSQVGERRAFHVFARMVRPPAPPSPSVSCAQNQSPGSGPDFDSRGPNAKVRGQALTLVFEGRNVKAGPDPVGFDGGSGARTGVLARAASTTMTAHGVSQEPRARKEWHHGSRGSEPPHAISRLHGRRRSMGGRPSPGSAGGRRLLLLGADDGCVLPPVLRRPARPARQRAISSDSAGGRGGGFPPVPAVPAGRAEPRAAARGGRGQGLPADRGGGDPAGSRCRSRRRPA